MTATEMATELGERIKHEGEKLRALELITLPARKEEPKGHGKFKLFMLLATCVGIGYGIFRAMRSRSDEQMTFTPRVADRPENGSSPERKRDERAASAV